MAEFHGHVAAVVQEILGAETTVDLLAGATQIPIDDMVDFAEEGGSALIAGEVYTYSEAVDDSDGDTGRDYITLTSGLLADLPAESRVDVWNPNTSATVTEWHATVTDDNDGSSMSAPLTHTLIAMLPEGVGGLIGESAVARTDEAGEWWVVEVIGATPRINPGFFVSGGIGTDTVVWAGTEDGRRAQLDGIDGALEAFNDADEQTVNFDGESNYAFGTFGTAKDGSRVELGEGVDGTAEVNEVRFYSGSAFEVDNSAVRSAIDGTKGLLQVVGPVFEAGVSAPRLLLLTQDGVSFSTAELDADVVNLYGVVNLVSSGGVGGSGGRMGAGSVGTGTFRDSVDARVTAVGGAAFQPLDSDLTAIAALSTTAFGRALLALADSAALAAQVAAASTSAAGVVELATTAETTTGTDTTRAVTPAGGKAAYRPRLLAIPAAITTATYTLATTDADLCLQFNSTSPQTVTLPTDATAAIPNGTLIHLRQINTGLLSLAADTSGVGSTIRNPNATLNAKARYATIMCHKTASNIWTVTGDLA